MSELDLFGSVELPGKPDVWSVSTLTDRIKDLLEGEVGSVKVSGEISNFRRQSSGHCYFSLKDPDAQIQAVLFRGDASRISFEPKDGDQVIATGVITVYKPRGNYQIRVQSLKPEGQGSLQAQFEALKEKLKAEGLFDESLKKPLPVFPLRVGVVTSATGAAFQDLINVLHRRSPHIQIVLGPVRVQGEEAAGEIAERIEDFDRLGNVDVLVVTRGGGSLEDLWAFNEEKVARAVHACQLPVISAVGHEIDFSIADFVADLRAPTPSAAAELVAVSAQEWQERLADRQRRMRQELDGQIEERRRRLQAYRTHYVFREPVRLVEAAMQRADDLRERMDICVKHRWSEVSERRSVVSRRWRKLDPIHLLRDKRTRIESLRRQMELLSPQGVLDRGYALAFDLSGGLVRSVESLQPSDQLSVQLRDGQATTRIERVKDRKFGESL